MTPFSMHSQAEWELRSGDPRLPKWLRVAAAAFGKHRRNGHASFAPGDLALVLASIDTDTGEVAPDANVSRSIATAVEYGWLSEKSCATCLVLPAHSVWGGAGGNPHAPCLFHR